MEDGLGSLTNSSDITGSGLMLFFMSSPNLTGKVLIMFCAHSVYIKHVQHPYMLEPMNGWMNGQIGG